MQLEVAASKRSGVSNKSHAIKRVGGAQKARQPSKGAQSSRTQRSAPAGKQMLVATLLDGCRMVERASESSSSGYSSSASTLPPPSTDRSTEGSVQKKVLSRKRAVNPPRAKRIAARFFDLFGPDGDELLPPPTRPSIDAALVLKLFGDVDDISDDEKSLPPTPPRPSNKASDDEMSLPQLPSLPPPLLSPLRSTPPRPSMRPPRQSRLPRPSKSTRQSKPPHPSNKAAIRHEQSGSEIIDLTHDKVSLPRLPSPPPPLLSPLRSTPPRPSERPRQPTPPRSSNKAAVLPELLGSDIVDLTHDEISLPRLPSPPPPLLSPLRSTPPRPSKRPRESTPPPQDLDQAGFDDLFDRLMVVGKLGLDLKQSVKRGHLVKAAGINSLLRVM